MAHPLATLLLQEATNPDPHTRQSIASLLQSNPSVIPDLIFATRDIAQPPDSPLFFTTLLLLDSLPDLTLPPGALPLFLSYLDIAPPTATLHHLCRVISRHFRSTAALFRALSPPPLTAPRVFCLLASAIMHSDCAFEYNDYFIDALCSHAIPLDQRALFARFLTAQESTGDWAPLRALLDHRASPFEFTTLLSILLEPDDVVLCDDLAQPLLRLLPELHALYAAADPRPFRFEDDVVRNAIEGVLRHGQSAFDGPWDDAELRAVFRACWELLNGPRAAMHSADDFFSAYIDAGDADDAPFQDHICALMAAAPAMRRQCEERLRALEQLDLAAAKLLAPLCRAADAALLRKLAVGSPDPAWQLFVFSFLSARGVRIADDRFRAMLAGGGWGEAMVAVRILEIADAELLPPPEIVAMGVARGFEIVACFATEMANQYLEHLDLMLRRVLTRAAVRVALAQRLADCLAVAWAHVGGCSPRFGVRMARLICRFVRFPEFGEWIRIGVMEPFLRLLECNRELAFDFASRLVFAAPEFLPQVGGAVRALGGELEKRLLRREWSAEVCEVALYFVVNGERAIEPFCLHRLRCDLLASGEPHFVALLVAVLQRSESREILDVLMQAGEMSRDFVVGEAFFVVAAILDLGGSEIRAEHANRMIEFCVENHQDFRPNSLRDRLLLAFLCRVLTVRLRGQEGTAQWQGIWRLCMAILEVLVSDDTLVGSAKPFCKPVKHYKLLCSELGWVCEAWNSYVGTMLQGWEVPTEIAVKLDEVKG